MKKHQIKTKCPLLLKQFYQPNQIEQSEDLNVSKEKQKYLRKEYEALFDDIDQLMFSDQEQQNSSPERTYEQQLQQYQEIQQQQPNQQRKFNHQSDKIYDNKERLNLTKINSLSRKNQSQKSEESSGRGSNRAAKIQFKLLQSDEPMSSARAGDQKPKVGGLNLASAFKINSANLNRFQNQQNSSPNNSPKWPQQQPPTLPINRSVQNKEAMDQECSNISSSNVGTPLSKISNIQISQEKQQKQTAAVSLINIGSNIPKNQMQQLKMIQQRGLDPSNIDRDTPRIQQQHLKYKNQISQIIDGLLYLGGQYVASNKQQLMDTGITHIINCACDYCPSPFGDQFKYKNYHLKDTKQQVSTDLHIIEINLQSIECVFYDAIAFIEQAKISGGKAFVHCVQGISRSSTICMAYLIFTKKIDLNEALAYVQSRRQIANPNLNFIIQLIWFHRRLYLEYHQLSNSVNPRIFLISSHEVEDPHFIVARLLIEPLFKQKKGKKFDSKGVFLIQSQKQFAIWVGKLCKGLTREKYIQKALSYVKIIHKNQKPAQKIKLSDDLKQVKIYQEEKQNQNFLKLWKDSSTKPVLGEDFSQKVHEWEKIFRDLENCELQNQQQTVGGAEGGRFSSPLSSPQEISTNPTSSSGGNSLVDEGYAEGDDNELAEKDQRPKHFYQQAYTISTKYINLSYIRYPNSIDNIGDLQVQQLIPTKLYVLCVTDNYTMQKTAYIWKGEEFKSDSILQEGSFINQCIQNYFGEKDDVIIFTEVSLHFFVDSWYQNIDDESDRFMNYLY